MVDSPAKQMDTATEASKEPMLLVEDLEESRSGHDMESDDEASNFGLSGAGSSRHRIEGL